MSWSMQRWGDHGGRSQRIPVSKREDTALFPWVTADREEAITSTYISLAQTSKQYFQSMYKSAMVQITTIVYLSDN